jgi:gluconolactonase
VIGEKCTFSHFSFATSLNPFFSKGCAYIRDKDELYVTSELLPSTTSSTLPAILISKVSIYHRAEVILADWTKLRPPPNMPMPSGAIHYKNGILYCSQGTLEPSSGGLFYMARGKRPVPVVTNYFGKPFNSIQSVVEDKEGALWFTDSCAGHEQEIRPEPQLPNHVYWFHPTTGELRVVMDDLKRPSGITLDPGETTLYVTDTDAARVGNTAAATRYARSPTLCSRTFVINRVAHLVLRLFTHMILSDGQVPHLS